MAAKKVKTEPAFFRQNGWIKDRVCGEAVCLDEPGKQVMQLVRTHLSGQRIYIDRLHNRHARLHQMYQKALTEISKKELAALNG